MKVISGQPLIYLSLDPESAGGLAVVDRLAHLWRISAIAYHQNRTNSQIGRRHWGGQACPLSRVGQPGAWCKHTLAQVVDKQAVHRLVGRAYKVARRAQKVENRTLAGVAG